jgi:serine/threonine protein kinase
LVRLLRRSRLVEGPVLKSYLARLREAGYPLGRPPLLAAALVRDGLLTPFQANQLLQGRWRGFTLGKYRVLAPLGAGGMGGVFLCEHQVMHRLVALKVLPGRDCGEPAADLRLEREAHIAAVLDHPNVVRAYDIDQVGRRRFLVMEYVDGVTLEALVSRQGPLTVARAAAYVRQAAQGLRHIHEAGIVHRDVKPANLILDRQGVVKILDLGLARFCRDPDDDHRLYEADDLLGTADYLAPEQGRDSHTVDPRADLYSLGCTFYYLLSGRPAVQRMNWVQKVLSHQVGEVVPIRDLRPDVPAPLAGVLERLMARPLGQRYPTAAAVLAALEPWTQTPIALPTEAEIPVRCPAIRARRRPSGQRSRGHLFEAEVFADTTDGPRQLFPQGHRIAAQAFGDGGPFMAEGALFGEVAFFGGQPSIQFPDQLMSRHDLAWAGGTVQQGLQSAVHHVVLEAALVAPVGIVFASLVSNFVPRHGDQQLGELLGTVQAKAAGSRPDEEAGHHRLADIRGFKDALQTELDQG